MRYAHCAFSIFAWWAHNRATSRIKLSLCKLIGLVAKRAPQAAALYFSTRIADVRTHKQMHKHNLHVYTPTIRDTHKHINKHKCMRAAIFECYDVLHPKKGAISMVSIGEKLAFIFATMGLNENKLK